MFITTLFIFSFTENDTVVVLAATNDVNVLDKALIRPGRFDTQVQVLLPDIKGRRDILKLYLDKLSSGTMLNKHFLRFVLIRLFRLVMEIYDFIFM